METTNQAILVRRVRRGSVESLCSPGLLLRLGLKRKRVYFLGRVRRKQDYSRRSLSFWERSDLEDLLSKAKDNYRQQMKRVHPDISGSNDGSEAITLNLVWSRLKKLYEQKGLEI